MDEIIRRLHEWNNYSSNGPVQIQLHLTNFCNLKCFFCPTRTLIHKKELNEKEELKTEDWLRIVDEGNKLDIKEWHICGGGEPFFFKEKALSVVNKIKVVGKHCEIITNGTLFNDDIIKNLLAMEVDKITFSVDGSNAKIHESIRGIKCFEAMKRNLELFRYWKNALHTKKPRIAFHVVVCNENFKDIFNLVKFAGSIGAEDVLINALNIWSDEIRKLELNKKQIIELNNILIKSQEYASKHQINTNISEFISLSLFDKANFMDKSIYMPDELVKQSTIANAPCYMPWYNMSVFSDGECKPCFILKEKGPSLRNASLNSIWLGAFYNKIRNNMKNNNVNKDCSKCNPWSFYKNKEIKEELRKT